MDNASNDNAHPSAKALQRPCVKCGVREADYSYYSDHGGGFRWPARICCKCAHRDEAILLWREASSRLERARRCAGIDANTITEIETTFFALLAGEMPAAAAQFAACVAAAVAYTLAPCPSYTRLEEAEARAAEDRPSWPAMICDL
jgi:hypothetical protein